MTAADFRKIPSVDRTLATKEVKALADAFGATAAADGVRTVLEDCRRAIANGGVDDASLTPAAIAAQVAAHLAGRFAPSLRPVLNLTGTVIHTNLGRAVLPPEAVEAMVDVATAPANLEYDLAQGKRGDRDSHLEAQICRLTGAEAATVVNNNAAAVLLVLNTLARRKEVLVSRGELVEIGGAFRIPDVMARAGAKLQEVGTTNRTHLKDYAEAIGPRTALLMKVHTSNYEVRGFTKAVEETELAALARQHDLPFVVDLGSGMLVDLERWGLPHERTAQETLADGADIVTFSGDKLLGGPQAGIIAGRAELVSRIRKNPMKRALRLDKLVIAALSATLRLYETPETLSERAPTLRALTRPVAEIEELARGLLPPVTAALGKIATAEIAACQSQIGSGALPVDLLPSAALVIRPTTTGKQRAGAGVARLANAFRALPTPMIGRIADNALWFDLRCLDEAAQITSQLAALDLSDQGS